MNDILNEIMNALNSRLYYISLVATLTVPDICGALEVPGGQATAALYRGWFNRYLSNKYPKLTADDCYKLRCGVIHQGRFGHPGSQYARVIFTLPNPQNNVFHNNIFHDALNLDLCRFCNEIVQAARDWFNQHSANQNVVANLPNLVQFRVNGLAAYLSGTPVIT